MMKFRAKTHEWMLQSTTAELRIPARVTHDVHEGATWYVLGDGGKAASYEDAVQAIRERVGDRWDASVLDTVPKSRTHLWQDIDRGLLHNVTESPAFVNWSVVVVPDKGAVLSASGAAQHWEDGIDQGKRAAEALVATAKTLWP